MTKVSVLHIGKTGGTALKELLRPKVEEAKEAGFELELHHHRTKFRDVVKGDETTMVAFFVRDPVKRFVSAFNSRLRQGQPRHNRPWSIAEKIIFEFFKTPDELALALSSQDPGIKVAAQLAMRTIRHVRNPLSATLRSLPFLKKHSTRIFFIGDQGSYDDDVKELLGKLGLPAELPELTEEQKHQTPEGFQTTLSPTGEHNIREWFSSDYKIYDWCVRQKKKKAKRAAKADQVDEESSEEQDDSDD